MLNVGDTVQGWQVQSLLHEGTMAVTYLVTRPPDRCRYALKMLYMRDPQFQERLRRAGQAQRSFTHPNLVAVVDTVEINGAPGLVSLYMEGTDLATWAAEKPRTPKEVLEVVRGLAEGLSAAHKRGLIHRNLKPQKVLIDRVGVPHIHDFMLGKVVGVGPSNVMTQMGMTFGTPQYMSPEQFRGAADVDARADLFSLGCLMFEILTNERAFGGESLMDVYRNIAESSYPKVASLRPDVPGVVDRLLDWLLQSDREQRPASARALIEALDSDPELRQVRGLGPPQGPPGLAVQGPLILPPTARTAGVTLTPEADAYASGLVQEGLAELPHAMAENEEAPMPIEIVEEPPHAAVPSPPSLVEPETQYMWTSVLGLLVVGVVISGIVFWVVMGGG